jgi:protein-S-isoprenylcysteine O-methyltransferase
MAIPKLLGLIYFISELLLTATRRSCGTGTRDDRSTLRLIWIIIVCSVVAAVFVALRVPSARVGNAGFCQAAGALLFAAGIALRWWAIVVLGRFFTVDVQIARDHELVAHGPFRIIRHPSYTGILLAFAGLGLSLANWLALLVLLVPIFAAFIHRMNVEEEALTLALGERYVAYKGRTSRLVPGFY